MRIGMPSGTPTVGYAAKGMSPFLEKTVVLPRSLTVMDGHELCALARYTNVRMKRYITPRRSIFAPVTGLCVSETTIEYETPAVR